MLPDAPGLFSTTTLCPNAFHSGSALYRAVRSVEPPDVTGTTSVIGREGKVCPPALSAKPRTAATVNKRFIKLNGLWG